MSQFSLKRLLVSVAIIALGCAMMKWGVEILRLPSSERPGWQTTKGELLLVASIPMILCGILNIYKRPLQTFLFVFYVWLISSIVRAIVGMLR